MNSSVIYQTFKKSQSSIQSKKKQLTDQDLQGIKNYQKFQKLSDTKREERKQNLQLV
jgi:hypothetical protein